jgi:hypothetical protein
METAFNPASQNCQADEFGGLDEEVCADDLESVVARYDLGLPIEDAASSGSVEVGKGVDTQSSVQARSCEADSDDEFGDGFSDLDFEAAEAAATQSLQHSASNSATVGVKIS